MEDIIIPMSEILHRRPEESILTSSSGSIAESSEGCEVLTKIDFLQFPKDIRDSTEEDLQYMAKQLSEKLTKIQNVFETVNPDFKVCNIYNFRDIYYVKYVFKNQSYEF